MIKNINNALDSIDDAGKCTKACHVILSASKYIRQIIKKMTKV